MKANVWGITGEILEDILEDVKKNELNILITGARFDPVVDCTFLLIAVEKKREEWEVSTEMTEWHYLYEFYEVSLQTFNRKLNDVKYA